MEPQPPQQRSQHPLANYQFSADELRVLRECNTESFFQRSLPLGTALGVAAYMGVKNGYLQPNLKFGAIPKVVVSVIVGYFVGKFSYQQKCAEKLMRLPNSRLAEVLRQRKEGGWTNLNPDQNLSMGMALAPFSSGVSEEAGQPAQSSALNLDTESRPTLAGLDDIYRPSLDTPSNYLEAEIPITPVKPGMTYEELRKKNREDFANKQANPYTRPVPPDAPTIIRERETRKPVFGNEQDLSTQQGHRNKYGDTWTD